METRVQMFHASSAGRKELSVDHGYVYCSRTKPAVVAEKDGRTMAYFLAPFATKESRETIRQNANFHALYFSLCHNLEAGRAAVRDLAGVARDLGYRVSLSRPQNVSLTRVEDILAPGNSNSVEARNDFRPMTPAHVPPSASRHDWAFDKSFDEFAQRPEGLAHRTYPFDDIGEEGLLAGPRRLSNHAFEILDEMEDWMLGW